MPLRLVTGKLHMPVATENNVQQLFEMGLRLSERESGTHGFQVQPRRRVVERSFTWLSRNRRLAKDYERKVQTSEVFIEVAATRLVLRRLAGQMMHAASRHPERDPIHP